MTGVDNIICMSYIIYKKDMVILILIIVMYVMFYIGEEIRRYYPNSYVGRWWRNNICDDDPN